MKKLKDNLPGVLVLIATIAAITVLTALGKPVPAAIMGIAGVMMQAFLPAVLGDKPTDPPASGDAS